MLTNAAQQVSSGGNLPTFSQMILHEIKLLKWVMLRYLPAGFFKQKKHLRNLKFILYLGENRPKKTQHFLWVDFNAY